MFNSEASKALGLQGDLTATDLELLLKYLARDRQLLTYSGEVRGYRLDLIYGCR